MNIELLKIVLIVALSSSIITTALVQKIKEGFNFKKSKTIVIVSFFISMVIGTLFALSFSELILINCLWVGLISFIGADAIYKAFEDKIFTKFSDLQPKEEIIEIERSDINE